LLKEFLLIVVIVISFGLIPAVIPFFSLFNLMKNVPKNHLFNRLTKIAYFFGLIKLFGTKN